MSNRMLKIGEEIPSVIFRRKKGAKVEGLESRQLLANKNSLVIGVPGAFWSDYPSSMLAAYEYNFQKFKELGIDEIFVTSTDDYYVLSNWFKQCEFHRLMYLSDGNQEWAQKTGFLVDMFDGGLGLRSHRYVMILQNNILKKVFYEDFSHDPHTCFTETNAEKVLQYVVDNQKTWVNLGVRSEKSL